MKAVGQLEQVIRQNVWSEIVQHVRHNLGELAKFLGQRDLGRILQFKFCSHGALSP